MCVSLRSCLLAAGVLLLTNGTTMGQAAPPKELLGWGAIVSPNKKVKFKAVDDILTMTLPSGANDFSAELSKVTAPRILRPVKGDFSIQVSVAVVTPPGRVSFTRGRKPFTSAGLLIWQDAGNYIRLEHARCEAPPIVTYVNWELRSRGQWVRQGRFDEMPLVGESSTLRITRKGDAFTPEISSDGASWKSLSDIQVKWLADLQAGIVAINDTRIAFSPEFRGLKINGQPPE